MQSFNELIKPKETDSFITANEQHLISSEEKLLLATVLKQINTPDNTSSSSKEVFDENSLLKKFKQWPWRKKEKEAEDLLKKFEEQGVLKELSRKGRLELFRISFLKQLPTIAQQVWLLVKADLELPIDKTSSLYSKEIEYLKKERFWLFFVALSSHCRCSPIIHAFYKLVQDEIKALSEKEILEFFEAALVSQKNIADELDKNNPNLLKSFLGDPKDYFFIDQVKKVLSSHRQVLINKIWVNTKWQKAIITYAHKNAKNHNDLLDAVFTSNQYSTSSFIKNYIDSLTNISFLEVYQDSCKPNRKNIIQERLEILRSQKEAFELTEETQELSVHNKIDEPVLFIKNNELSNFLIKLQEEGRQFDRLSRNEKIWLLHQVCLSRNSNDFVIAFSELIQEELKTLSLKEKQALFAVALNSSTNIAIELDERNPGLLETFLGDFKDYFFLPQVKKVLSSRKQAFITKVWENKTFKAAIVTYANSDESRNIEMLKAVFASGTLSNTPFIINYLNSITDVSFLKTYQIKVEKSFKNDILKSENTADPKKMNESLVFQEKNTLLGGKNLRNQHILLEKRISSPGLAIRKEETAPSYESLEINIETRQHGGFSTIPNSNNPELDFQYPTESESDFFNQVEKKKEDIRWSNPTAYEDILNVSDHGRSWQDYSLQEILNHIDSPIMTAKDCTKKLKWTKYQLTRFLKEYKLNFNQLKDYKFNEGILLIAAKNLHMSWKEIHSLAFHKKSEFIEIKSKKYLADRSTTIKLSSYEKIVKKLKQSPESLKESQDHVPCSQRFNLSDNPDHISEEVSKSLFNEDEIAQFFNNKVQFSFFNKSLESSSHKLRVANSVENSNDNDSIIFDQSNLT